MLVHLCLNQTHLYSIHATDSLGKKRKLEPAATWILIAAAQLCIANVLTKLKNYEINESANKEIFIIFD